MGTRLYASFKSRPRNIRNRYKFNKLYGYVGFDELVELKSARYLWNLGKASWDELYHPEFIDRGIELTNDEFDWFMHFYEKDIQRHYKEPDFTLKKYFTYEILTLLEIKDDKIIYWM